MSSTMSRAVKWRVKGSLDCVFQGRKDHPQQQQQSKQRDALKQMHQKAGGELGRLRKQLVDSSAPQVQSYVNQLKAKHIQIVKAIGLKAKDVIQR